MSLWNRYQLSFSTLAQAGIEVSGEGIALMRRAVQLVSQARERFHNENPSEAVRVRTALSLGPFGASLPPAQEFGGFYPPPYGPKAFSTDGSNLNAFPFESVREASIQALATFHLQRLLVFLEDKSTWSNIDYIAFETVPLAREVTAIRRAMTRLRLEHAASPKPWWISLVFPDGVYPEMTLDGGHLTVDDAVRAVLSDMDDGDRPNAIGINCTKPEYLPSLLDSYETSIERLTPSQSPGLVVYPNGGLVCEIATKTWSSSSNDDSAGSSAWARDLSEIVKARKGRWSGILVGGCCKAGPQEIKVLAERVKSFDRRS
jgi:homocysteine S-methyltransferase